jgi:hypothetical protein
MSEEKDNAQTQPMLDALLDRLRRLEQNLNIRLDRIESEVKLVHSETLALRADFGEFRERSKEPV